jgi:class 3 adenylate cyclase
MEVRSGDTRDRAITVFLADDNLIVDPEIVEKLVSPVASASDLTPHEERLLQQIAEGRPIKAIAAGRGSTPSATAEAVEGLFLKLAQGASTGSSTALRRLRMLHQAIVDREEQGEQLSRLLPGGVADKVRAGGGRIGEVERMTVTVLMSDIRGYTSIAEAADPTQLAVQLNEHRAQMNHAILDHAGTVMQFVGDAVMAVFGAPVPNDRHADDALAAAQAMHVAQREVNRRWRAAGLPEFGLGIGVSTGEVAAALLGSEERLEYIVVGDAVNLTQRVQQWAEPGETVLTESTFAALTRPVDVDKLEPALVKGRESLVVAYRTPPRR